MSYIQRKPEPLGTEFKVVADTATGLMIHLEIQKGKGPMATAEFTNVHKATTACTKCLAKYTLHRIIENRRERAAEEEDNGQDNIVYLETWMGNSWFAGVKVASVGKSSWQ